MKYCSLYNIEVPVAIFTVCRREALCQSMYLSWKPRPFTHPMLLFCHKVMFLFLLPLPCKQKDILIQVFIIPMPMCAWCLLRLNFSDQKNLKVKSPPLYDQNKVTSMQTTNKRKTLTECYSCS